METQARVNAYALDVTASNVLAFLPALSQVQVARLTVTADRVELTTTDMYAAGRDSCPVFDLLGDPVTVLIDRHGLDLLAHIGRKDKKTQGTLTIRPGQGWRFDGMGEPFGGADVSAGNSQAWEMFAAIDDMIAEEHLFRTAFQPQLLSRFGKVSADKAERVADVAIDDPGAPVLVKIGTSFKGLIMPVAREVHAELVGQEGLW